MKWLFIIWLLCVMAVSLFGCASVDMPNYDIFTGWEVENGNV